MYVVALTFVFVVPISNLNGTSMDMKVAVIGSCIIVANTTVLCLIFLPKVSIINYDNLYADNIELPFPTVNKLVLVNFIWKVN